MNSFYRKEIIKKEHLDQDAKMVYQDALFYNILFEITKNTDYSSSLNDVNALLISLSSLLYIHLVITQTKIYTQIKMPITTAYERKFEYHLNSHPRSDTAPKRMAKCSC